MAGKVIEGVWCEGQADPSLVGGPKFIPKCVVCKGIAIENFLIGILCFDGP